MADQDQFVLPSEIIRSKVNSTAIATDLASSQLITTSPFPSRIIKLDSTNFLIWKLQVLPILRGHKLDKFVLKEEPLFMQEIGALEYEIDEEVLSKFSSEQPIWILQDQLLQ